MGGDAAVVVCVAPCSGADDDVERESVHSMAADGAFCLFGGWW